MDKKEREKLNKLKARAKKKVEEEKAKKAQRKRSKGSPQLDAILVSVTTTKKGVKGKHIEQISKDTGLSKKQLNNGLYKLMKAKKVKSLGRGTWIAI